jgi:hypothetical protein
MQKVRMKPTAKAKPPNCNQPCWLLENFWEDEFTSPFMKCEIRNACNLFLMYVHHGLDGAHQDEPKSRK